MDSEEIIKNFYYCDLKKIKTLPKEIEYEPIQKMFYEFKIHIFEEDYEYDFILPASIRLLFMHYILKLKNEYINQDIKEKIQFRVFTFFLILIIKNNWIDYMPNYLKLLIISYYKELDFSKLFSKENVRDIIKDIIEDQIIELSDN